MYGVLEETLASSSTTTTAAVAAAAAAQSESILFFNLSVLMDKVDQMGSMVGIIVSSDQMHRDSLSAAIAGAGALVQDIIVAASSMMFTFQQLANTGDDESYHLNVLDELQQPSRHDDGGATGDHVAQDPNGSAGGVVNIFSISNDGDYHEHINNSNGINKSNNGKMQPAGNETVVNMGTEFHRSSSMQETSVPSCDVIELDAADLLATYTHYCQVCGKGFKRDANLRMHMRAHGDEYKTSTALINPTKKNHNKDQQDQQHQLTATRKYSCPQEGCRWNRKHAKFQPLKSMVCVKNHYRRSHCPKVYVCNRCNRKQFSVVSDLRTHEKHCGDLKWQCSCGTSFSRKDKLMGHVALFVGHAPVAVAPPR